MSTITLGGSQKWVDLAACVYSTPWYSAFHTVEYGRLKGTRMERTPARRNKFTMRDLLVSEAGLAALGTIIVAARHSVASVIGAPASVQLAAAGTVAGGAIALLAAAVIRSGRLASPVTAGLGVLSALRLSAPVCLLLGVAAGIGEETLFRAALVPWIGVYAAAALFALAHAGTARLSEGVTAGKVAYLAIALCAGVALGLTYLAFGLLTTMCAHAAFDTVMLLRLRSLITAAGPDPAN
jgi:uncharacterized protein